MSKTVSLTNEEIINTEEEMQLLDQARLPGVSTIRFSRTLGTIEEEVERIESKLAEIERGFLKTDDAGDPVVEVFLSTGEKVGETPVTETTGPLGEQMVIDEYKDLDLEEIELSEYDVDEEEVDSAPRTRERYIVEDREQMTKEKGKMIQDTVELEIDPFPEEEFEEVLSAFKEQMIGQQVEEISETLGLGEEDGNKVRQILEPAGKNSRLKPSEIESISFLFPEV
jgi:hypothetical protein